MAAESELQRGDSQPAQREAATVDLPAAVHVHEGPTLDSRVPSSAVPAEDGAGAGNRVPQTRSFGDYELLGEIASGGMGIVYRARERVSGRLVALKMMLTESDMDAIGLQRFLLEARATSELSHPGIVAIHAWGEHEGRPFYTMDYVPGFPLSRILKNRPLSVSRAVRYLLGIARAVAVAHGQGIVHRDLKPSNIILDATDQPRILDFGLAKRHRRDSPEPTTTDRRVATALEERQSAVGTANKKDTPPATKKGAILGTPAYMAPEQARGEHDQVGPAADVHALGAIFFEMLTGRPPFQASTMSDTLVQVIEQKPPALGKLNPQVPASLGELCRRCLEKDAQERYPDAAALAEDLERRWRRTTQSRRFARLSLYTGILAVALFSAPSLFPALDRLRLVEWLAEWSQRATQSGGVLLEQPATVLAHSLGGFFFAVIPFLCQVAFLTWLGAWLWHSDRRWPLVGCGGIGAALAGVTLWYAPDSLASWLPLVIVAVVLLVSVFRVWSGKRASSSGSSYPEADPYLQKLFAVGRPLKSQSATATEPGFGIDLTDVELGRTMQSSTSCVLRKGRQKSLDRPVLVWFDPASRRPPSTPEVVLDGQDSARRESRSANGPPPAPGVVVRHGSVLNLHAVGSSPDGRFMVTEAVAATPLAELVERRRLEPMEAVGLLIKTAGALQAFHDQGACHGRLGPEWILVQSDSEPLLCPCGIPSQSEADRTEDVKALGILLRDWLPPRARRWQRRPLATLYRVCDAALAGEYHRPDDLAKDLECAARAAFVRSRERIAHGIVIALVSLPVLVYGGMRLWLFLASQGAPEAPMLGKIVDLLANNWFLVLAPGAILLGYAQGRSLAHQHQLRLRQAIQGSYLRQNSALAIVQLILVTGFPALLASLLGPGEGVSSTFRTFLLGTAELFGFWCLGICLTSLVTFTELLIGSLQAQASAELSAWIGVVGSLPETFLAGDNSSALSVLTRSRKTVHPDQTP